MILNIENSNKIQIWQNHVFDILHSSLSLNSTNLQHPDQKWGIRKFERLSGILRHEAVGWRKDIWESYWKSLALSLHLNHNVDTKLTSRFIRSSFIYFNLIWNHRCRLHFYFIFWIFIRFFIVLAVFTILKFSIIMLHLLKSAE